MALQSHLWHPVQQSCKLQLEKNAKIVLCTIAFNRIAMRLYAAYLGLRLGVRRSGGKSIRGGVTSASRDVVGKADAAVSRLAREPLSV